MFPKDTTRRWRGPPLLFGSSDPEVEMLVLRTYGLCGLSVDQRTAEKERVSGSKVISSEMIAKRKRSTIKELDDRMIMIAI